MCQISYELLVIPHLCKCSDTSLTCSAPDNSVCIKTKANGAESSHFHILQALNVSNNCNYVRMGAASASDICRGIVNRSVCVCVRV